MSGHHIVNSYFASANGRVAASQGLYSGSGSARNAGIWEEEKTIKKKKSFERRTRERDPIATHCCHRYVCADMRKRPITEPVTGG